jgi:hypothetical protein
VNWLGAATVPCAHVSAENYELLHDFGSVGCRGDVLPWNWRQVMPVAGAA